MINSICRVCQKSIIYAPSRIKKFCSIVCRSKGYVMSENAKQFARIRRIKMNKQFPISSEQAKINLSKAIRPKGKEHYRWNGGKKINQEGYRLIKCKEHPRKQNGYVMEHTLIMENHLGRFLDNEEIVHHIDNNKLNNSINNLMLFPNTTEHTQFHWNNKLWRKKSKSRP